MAFDPIRHYARNRDNVVKLRALIGEAFYEEAVFAALGLTAGQPGMTMDGYAGAQAFLKHLNSLTEDPIQGAPPLTARIEHSTDYGRRNRKSTGSASSDDSTPKRGKA